MFSDDRSDRQLERGREAQQPGAPPNGSKSTGRGRRLMLVLTAGMLICGLSAAVSWWANPEVSAVAVLMQHVSAPTSAPTAPQPVFRFGHAKEMTAEDITPEAAEAIARLSASFGDLNQDITRTQQRLMEQDPHLARAISDPYDTPLCGDQPCLQIDVARGFVPEMEAMVEDYLATTQEPEELVRQIAEPMRRVLIATLLKASIDPADLTALSTARESGADDPLLLLCLYRATPDNDSVQFELIRQAHASRVNRRVCPSLAALISSNLMLFNKKIPIADFHKLTETWIDDTIEVWKQYPDEDTDFAAQDFFINYTNNAFVRLNAHGRIALLEALDLASDTPVPAWLRHFIAFRVLESAASTYRGANYISKVKEDDLKRFQDFASQATQHLLKAWTLAPRHVLFPSILLSMEKRAGTTPLSEDAWFRHALSARFRVDLAFAGYESSAEPKWGGSFDKQLWLAKKYVEVEDVDTGIPVRAMKLLWTMSLEQALCERMGHDLRIRILAAKLTRSLKKHSRETPHPSVDADVLSMAAITLWEAGEFEDLDWLLRVYADKIECEGFFHEKRLHANEMAEIARAILEDRSSCWLTIQSNLYGDTRRLTISKLEETELALAEARALDDGSRSKYTCLLDSCETRARFLRRILSGELVTLSDEDLQSWLLVGKAMTVTFPNQGRAADEAAVSPALGEGQQRNDQADHADPRPLTVRPVPAGDVVPGVVDLKIHVPSRRGVLTCPVEIDLPLRFSMEIEDIEPGDDPYGISLLIGPTIGGSERQDYRGPILTLDPYHLQLIRDHLPVVNWEENVNAFQLKNRLEKYTITIEAFPDGYRTFYNGRELETVKCRLKTGGLVQLGRYISMYLLSMPTNHVKYRISNVQLQRLQRTSISELPAS